MTTPFWCLALAVVLPYLWGGIGVGSRKKELGQIDNKRPRQQQRELSELGARAYGAHYNAFEAAIVFAPAVIVAHLANADAIWSARLAVAWVVLRVLHGVLYLADIDKARTAVFSLALGAALGLFLLPVLM